uniref:Secreted protein n=1 Tax=Ascaris lumbricoides TaxID=6252 RepID=A0A0M3IHM1_ASCLU
MTQFRTHRLCAYRECILYKIFKQKAAAAQITIILRFSFMSWTCVEKKTIELTRKFIVWKRFRYRTYAYAYTCADKPVYSTCGLLNQRDVTSVQGHLLRQRQ